MVEIRSRLPAKPHAQYGVPVRDRLELPFERRQKSRQRATLASGEEVAIELPRGLVLRGGDCVLASDRVLERMLEGLGARLTALEMPFEPEAGAYGAHHRHDNESGHGGRIHEFR